MINEDSNQAPGIIKQVGSIYFPHMTILRLPDNNIESIEALNQIPMPSLSCLNIDFNKIIKVAPLAKGCWPLITSLSIGTASFMKMGIM